MPRIVRALILLVIAAAIYFAALSREVYMVASPPASEWHTILRKGESLAAFAFLGLLTAWTIGPRRKLPAILIISLLAYSALIEIGQRLTGTVESWRISLFDIVCGALGGAAAGLILQSLAKRTRRVRS